MLVTAAQCLAHCGGAELPIHLLSGGASAQGPDGGAAGQEARERQRPLGMAPVPRMEADGAYPPRGLAGPGEAGVLRGQTARSEFRPGAPEKNLNQR